MQVLISFLMLLIMHMTMQLAEMDQASFNWSDEPSSELRDDDIIDGVTLVAPPRSFPSDPMEDIKKTGAEWISTVPYGFVRLGDTNIRYNLSRQWWGEKLEGIVSTIEYAKSHQIGVMLKPQIWSPDGWIGDQKFETVQEWEQWEKSYREFILFYAQVAAENEVEILCVGTELKSHIAARPDYFPNLIKEIRDIYCGKLIYSANWDSFEEVSFWGDLDYIGLSAYFPLDESPLPKTKELKKLWKPICSRLNKLSQKHDRKIVFTEFGYLSVDGAAGKTWMLEKSVRSLKINEKAQSNCYQALFEVFHEEPYWAGGFLWKWFPFGQGGEGYNERDYTPQNKLAQSVLTEWYSKW